MRIVSLLFSPAYSNKNGCGAKREQCLCQQSACVFDEKCTGSKGYCLSPCMCPCVMAESTGCSITDKNNSSSSCAVSSWFHSSSQICFQLSWFLSCVSRGKIKLCISDDSLIQKSSICLLIVSKLCQTEPKKSEAVCFSNSSGWEEGRQLYCDFSGWFLRLYSSKRPPCLQLISVHEKLRLFCQCTLLYIHAN